MGSATTALEALEALAVQQPMGVSELARRLEISKPAAQRALSSLADAGWIQRSEQHRGRWVLSVKVLEVAKQMGRELGLRDAAAPLMQDLVNATGEAAHLSVLDRHDVVTIDQVESTQRLRIHWPIGARSAAYATASGKAILSRLGPDIRKDHLPARLDPLTTHTVVDETAMAREMTDVRRCGYAIQRGELRDDVASIAAPILIGPEQPVAALSVFMPVYRFPDDDGVQLGSLVVETAAKISSCLTLRR